MVVRNIRISQYIYLLSFLALCLIVLPSQSFGQQLLQLEIYDNPVAKKFPNGSTLIYQTKEYPEWRMSKIKNVDYENQIIIFNNGYENLEDITKIKIYKKWVEQLGLKLMQFSAAWFLYGGISTLINDGFDIGWDTVGIGGGALVTGFILYKFAGTKVYDVKGKDRLRIIDISWPEPRG